MAATTHARRLRLPVLGCLLFGLLVTHVSVRYLLSTLHGFAVYRGLDSRVSVAVLGLYVSSSLVVNTIVIIRHEAAGGVSGAGFVLFAVEPFTTIFEAGCQVAAGSGSPLLPAVTVDGIVVGLSTWNGSCGTPLNTPVIAVGLCCVAGGLWMANVPAVVLTRWLGVLDPYCPGRGVD
jgi:hypothetical protein